MDKDYPKTSLKYEKRVGPSVGQDLGKGRKNPIASKGRFSNPYHVPSGCKDTKLNGKKDG